MAGALIGALRVSLSAETTAFEAGMKKSQRTARTTAANINSAFANVGNRLERSVVGFVTALTLGTLVRAGRASLEFAGHLGELADTLGITTKDLQTFSYAAGQVGISQEELEKGIQKLTISMGQAQLGAQAQVKAFNAVGISVDDLKGKNAGEVFRLLADRLEKVTDRSQRAAVEVALFGRAGARLDNLLSGSQGRLSELSDAAERLGIVLSDDQIRHADETADKIDALQTVLKARIAGAVADNADSILDLANAIATLISTIGPAITGLKKLYVEMKAAAPFFALGPIGLPFAGMAADRAGAQFDRQNRLRSIPLLPPELRPRRASAGGDGIGQFLAPRGGGGGGRKDHSAEDLQRKQLDALRKSFDFAQDQLRADQDILEAKKDLSGDYVEQTSLQIDILNLQREQYRADLAYQVKQNEITKGADGISQAQADILLAKYDEADHAKRQKVLADEQTHRLEDVAMLTEHDFERKRDILQKEADLADTQAERRKIELDLLELAYEEKRQALQRIIDTSKDAAAIEDARRDLLTLNKNYALDRAGVIQQTQSPLQQYFSGLPHAADQINEALQNIEVEGIQGLSNALAQAGKGWGAMRDAAIQALDQIAEQLIQLGIQRMLFSLFGNAVLGGGGAGMSAMSSFVGPLAFAGGGFVSGPGSSTADRVPAMLSNGEFVMSAQAVRSFGLPFLSAINRGSMPHMKGGGLLGALSFFSPAAFLATHTHGNPLRFISPLAFLASKMGKSPLDFLSPALGLAGAFDGKGGGGKSGHTFNIHVNAPNTGNPTRDRQTSIQQAADIRRAVGDAVAQGLL